MFRPARIVYGPLFLALLLGYLLFFVTMAHSNDATHRLPDQQRKMQVWLGDALEPYIQSGCAPAISASLTLAAFACEGYVLDTTTGELLYVGQDAHSVGPLNLGNGTYWLAISRDLSTVHSGWTRQAGTQYLWQASATQPAAATGLLVFERVTVSGGTITGVVGIGLRNPISRRGPTLKDYGAVGDGLTNDSMALQNAITSQQCIYVPEGTYYIPNVAILLSGTVCLEGAGMGKSIFLAKTATVPSCVAGGNSNLYSYSILEITNATRVSLRHLTFDGGRTSGPYCNNGSYVDQHSLIDIRESSNITFTNVETTKYAGTEAVAAGGGTVNPISWYDSFNFGPVYIKNSSYISIVESKATSPSFNEGWLMTESNTITIDKFTSTAGSIDDVQYGQASPIGIFGITDNCHTIKVINSTIKNNNGSLAIYCTRDIIISNNHFNNGYGIIMWDSLFSPLLAPPNGVLPADIPIIDNVVISNNIFFDMLSYCISLGKSVTPGTIRASNVSITGNVCRQSGGGFILGDTIVINVTGNTIYQATELVPGYIAADISITDSGKVDIVNNILDGTVALANGSGRCANGAGCKTLNNIEVVNCEICSITNNTIADATTTNILVTAATDDTYSSLVVRGNTMKNVTVVPATAILIGPDITHRYKDAYVTENTINNAMQTALQNGGNTGVYAVTPLADLNTVQAYRNTSSAGLTTTPAIVIFNGLEYDSWKSSSNVAVLNTSTGVFTLPPGRRGFQSVQGAISVTNLASATSVVCGVYVGGVVKKQVLNYVNGAASPASPTVAFSTVLWVAGSDTIDLRCASDDPANPVLTGTSDKTFITVQSTGSF